MIEVLNAKDGRPVGEYDLLLYCGRSTSYRRAKRLISDELVDGSAYFDNYSSHGKTAKSLFKRFMEGYWSDVIAESLTLLANRVADERIALVCWCKPKTCHCDHIAEVISELAKGNIAE